MAHAAAGELVLWCPSCRQQIVRMRGQVSVPRLALAEVKHIDKCPAKKENEK